MMKFWFCLVLFVLFVGCVDSDDCTPNYVNSSWVNMTDCICGLYEQNLTEYDNNSCNGSVNTTYFQWLACVYVPSYINSSWALYSSTECFPNSTRLDWYSLIQHDIYYCNGTVNTTFYMNNYSACVYHNTTQILFYSYQKASMIYKPDFNMAFLCFCLSLICLFMFVSDVFGVRKRKREWWNNQDDVGRGGF